MTASTVRFAPDVALESSGEISAVELTVVGVVQGVGFRPFVHRLAVRHALRGWIRNQSGDVRIAVQGSSEALLEFLQALQHEAPSLARIESVTVTRIDPFTASGFRILSSAEQPDQRQPVSPDVAICAACERELWDRANRRYRYPFITCTDCGPRFTVIESMPYDRERTSMRAFEQCPACEREYRTPTNRRFHSETNSCDDCGPEVSLVQAGEGRPLATNTAAIATAGDLLRLGLIIGVRGLGGFHLATDATSERAVVRLRERKHRNAKPMAIMVRTLEEARCFADLTPMEERTLMCPERPIMVARRRKEAALAPSIAPGLRDIGIMVAYTPLHHLLLDEVRRPLVMTSGNVSEEPIATSNEDALRRLGTIADAFLLHNRDIVSRYDDSVVRVVSSAPLFLRRARGYAPLPLSLPIPAPKPIVAVGPHLKNTITLAHGNKAYVSQHIGDLENLETLEHFQQTYRRQRELFQVFPEIGARDLHPGYLSTSLASDLGLARVIEVQHHHAHLAAVAAEHGVTDTIIGVLFDGTGYGTDGCVWGAEVFAGNLTGYRRLGHLRYVPLAGGDLAARRPWRVALGYSSLTSDAQYAFARAFDGVDPSEHRLAQQQIDVGLNAPLASSMGRLFDAAAAVLGIRHVSLYEGQAAMELEALAGCLPATPLPFPIVEDEGGVYLLDPLPLLIALGSLRAHGHDIAVLAARFHESVAHATLALVSRVAQATSLTTVALGGGVFQNARLLTRTHELLEEAGLQVLLPRQLSPNDGAISYGQAAVAAAVLTEET